MLNKCSKVCFSLFDILTPSQFHLNDLYIATLLQPIVKLDYSQLQQGVMT